MAETPSIEEKKSSKKLFVIIAIVVLLLGASAGGYFFFMHKPDDTKQSDGGGKQDKEETTKAEEVVEPEVYYDLVDPLIVDFPPGSSAKIIKISVSVLIKGESDVEALKKHEPMIRNNLLMLISSVGADKVKTIEGKKELQAMMLSETGNVMEKMTKKNPVKDVFFTEFVMQ
jgi:flagellar protein FliL